MKYPFETRRPIAASEQMLILYGVKSVGGLSKSAEELYPLLFLIHPPPPPPLRFDSIDWRGVRQPARISRTFHAWDDIYIYTVVYSGIGTLRKGVVFQVSREKKSAAGRWKRGGEGSGGGKGSHRWRDAEGGKVR